MIYVVLLLAYFVFSFVVVHYDDTKRMAKFNEEQSKLRGRAARDKWEQEYREKQEAYFRNEPLGAKLWRWFKYLPFGIAMYTFVGLYKGLMYSLYPFASISDWWGLVMYNRERSRIEKWCAKLVIGQELKAPVFDDPKGVPRLCIDVQRATVAKVEPGWITVMYRDGTQTQVSEDSMYELNK